MLSQIVHRLVVERSGPDERLLGQCDDLQFAGNHVAYWFDGQKAGPHDWVLVYPELHFHFILRERKISDYHLAWVDVVDDLVVGVDAIAFVVERDPAGFTVE